ncbi:MAG: galactose-1-phosphate uridylyltransferase [Candidatus Bathyarchaeia archaeon]|jgi:UDPglucose--hexose-1-phosphate uridylyltransferase
MPYNELRKDYLLNRWVVIATERSRRPNDFVKQKTEPAKSTVCPMCVGNEHMTPPAMMLYLKEDGGIKKSKDPLVGERPKNWLVRCIPNLYPAFSPPRQPEDETQIMKSECFGSAIGHHEVIIESPNHDEDPADAELPQLELVIKACIDRLRELSAKPYVKYVSIFRNYGQEAGASLSHAHSQIIATPMVPSIIQEELEASKAFYDKHGKCVFCDIIEKEVKGPRFVLENNDFIVFAPYASINPMAFWIMPKKHAPSILDLTRPEVSAFAQTLKASLKALKDLVNDPPYNYGFHLAINKEAKDHYHWHLEVYPKLSIWAGFEISTGTYINTITPETAADSLRKAIKP